MSRLCAALLLVALCLLPLNALADDPPLVDIYNTLFQTNLSAGQLGAYLVTGADLRDPMIGQVRAEAMFGQSNTFVMGTYNDPGVGSYRSDLLTVTTRGYLNGQPRVILNPASRFGFYLQPGNGTFATKFSEAALNPASCDNLRTYATPYPNIYLLAWEEADGCTEGDYRDFVATLRVDTPPVAVAATIGAPFAAAPNHRAQVTLDGSGSSDADGDPLTYHWSWAGGAAVGRQPVVTLLEGNTTVTLVVNDGIADSAPATVAVSVSAAANIVPVAAAGQDQLVSPDLDHLARVTLNGSGSYDGNEDPLTYSWTWSGGSATGVSPTVTLPQDNTYVVTLVVSDGIASSAPSTCTVTVGHSDNVAPVVTAPNNLVVHASQDGVAHVPLTAYGFDANSDPLTYTWSWSGGSASGQSVTADLPESTSPYVITVQAYDGQAYSGPQTFQVSVLPALPVADAGPTPAPLSAALNHTQQVTLDGSSSYSRYGHPLTYSWSWPPSKTASGPNPTVTLPEGQTTVILVVNDGSYDSEPAAVVVNVLPAANVAPVAEAGPDQIINPDLNHRVLVQLDGSQSYDPNQDQIYYTWTWTDLGNGQAMQATGPSPQVSLYEGTNAVTLSVSDGQVAVTDSVTVTVGQVANVIPVADAGHDQTVWPRTDRTAVIKLNGSASHDDNQDPLTYTWTWTDLTTGQPRSEQGMRPTVVLPVGVTVISLTVNDGKANSTNPATVTITVTPFHAQVPDDFVHIQDAINACQDGDTVVLSRGTYSEPISFHGKAITIEGEKGWEDTVIQAVGTSVVTFANGEGPGSRLYNVTIKNGFNISGGAGIRIENASPTIVSCQLTQNSQGGAIYVTGSTSAPRLSNLLIVANNSSNSGSAIWVDNSAAPVITNCTIYGNASNGLSGALYLDNNCAADFRDCIIWNNAPRNIFNNFTRSTFIYCDIGSSVMPGVGNISADPAFKIGTLSNYYLKPTSPCVDAGSQTVADWVTEMSAYGQDIGAEAARANTRADGRADTGLLDIGFHHHPRPVRIVDAWVTDTSGTRTTRLVRTKSYFCWVKYEIEGLSKASYISRTTASISGAFALARSGKMTSRPGTYQKQIGTTNNPITVPQFSMPPGMSTVPAHIDMKVQVKRANATSWKSSDTWGIDLVVY